MENKQIRISIKKQNAEGTLLEILRTAIRNVELCKGFTIKFEGNEFSYDKDVFRKLSNEVIRKMCALKLLKFGYRDKGYEDKIFKAEIVYYRKLTKEQFELERIREAQIKKMIEEENALKEFAKVAEETSDNIKLKVEETFSNEDKSLKKTFNETAEKTSNEIKEEVKETFE